MEIVMRRMQHRWLSSNLQNGYRDKKGKNQCNQLCPVAFTPYTHPRNNNGHRNDWWHFPFPPSLSDASCKCWVESDDWWCMASAFVSEMVFIADGCCHRNRTRGSSICCSDFMILVNYYCCECERHQRDASMLMLIQSTPAACELRDGEMGSKKLINLTDLPLGDDRGWHTRACRSFYCVRGKLFLFEYFVVVWFNFHSDADVGKPLWKRFE